MVKGQSSTTFSRSQKAGKGFDHVWTLIFLIRLNLSGGGAHKLNDITQTNKTSQIL